MCTRVVIRMCVSVCHTQFLRNTGQQESSCLLVRSMLCSTAAGGMSLNYLTRHSFSSFFFFLFFGFFFALTVVSISLGPLSLKHLHRHLILQLFCNSRAVFIYLFLFNLACPAMFRFLGVHCSYLCCSSRVSRRERGWPRLDFNIQSI